MPRAFIALGSNLDPERHIPAALRRLAAAVRLVAVSTFYLSPALGRPEQPDFYNGAVEIETDRPPRELKFAVLREIEAALGRRRSFDKYAAREIDLDLVWYEGLSVHEPDLVLPDPEIAERAFLAVPLAELAPDLFRVGGSTGFQACAGADAGLEACATPEALRPLPGFTARLRKELFDEPRESTAPHP